MNHTTLKPRITGKKNIFLIITTMAALSASKLSFSMDIIEEMEKNSWSEKELYANVEKLVTTGEINVNEPSKDGKTVLHWACSRTNPELVNERLSMVNTILPKCTAETINRPYNGQPAHKKFIENNPDPKKSENIGYKRLILKTVKLAIKCGVNIAQEAPKLPEEIIKNAHKIDLYNLENIELVIVRYSILTRELDALTDNPDNLFKIIGFIDNQSDDGILDVLCGRLYARHGIKYDGIKKSLKLRTNTKGLNRFKDFKIITQDQE
jgi:hypothetical protein